MHAVIGQVKIDPSREGEVRTALSEVVVPTAKAMPGFVGGTWSRSVQDDRGISLLLFESEEAARAAAEQMRQGPPPGTPATFVSADVFEVVAQA
jgi:Antibiotic biosynthesis monooxygenase